MSPSNIVARMEVHREMAASTPVRSPSFLPVGNVSSEVSLPRLLSARPPVSDRAAVPNESINILILINIII